MLQEPHVIELAAVDACRSMAHALGTEHLHRSCSRNRTSIQLSAALEALLYRNRTSISWQRGGCISISLALATERHSIGRGGCSSKRMLKEPNVIKLTAEDAPRSACSWNQTSSSRQEWMHVHRACSRNRASLSWPRWTLLEAHQMRQSTARALKSAVRPTIV